ncbi:2-oxoadipate dioxygenase/decarboxylase HglS [Allosediminivita pacifica]|uniref:2-oxoadipate dioxygenase/decarboxylase n=1 Tax=Allosediminivita pacifica TaxID=1267769 RepID=A0A2T6A6I7_9RHOB|nr:VOC family protein [Allosediminivita pacifica]PTX39396.1 putative glyoxalase superfamily metalloenzyme YdcJ [Allosediminivita pacifica]GGB28081.1 DUF1338 domain-containing protein [Allosediminivita pacifica]
MAHLHPDEIRARFSRAMSEMYRAEVPQYGTLIELVSDVNAEVLERDPALRERLADADELDRLDVERHGAIRLGTPGELAQIRRMFAVMGMGPVGYYDLSVAGLPVHSTAFRPVATEALSRNPFRVFTSLLRLELIEDRALAERAAAILSERSILTERAQELIALCEVRGGLTEDQAEEFVAEAIETFRWRSDATVTAQTYSDLHETHRLIADVVSFRGPHINHLTPRTLDIDRVQELMPERGITPKAVIEGPPRRGADILLRQTSFKALEEPILFAGENGGTEGTHTARFGEIEQRGVALTPKGRALYDETLAAVRAAAPIGAQGQGADAYRQELDARFAEVFPDDLNALRREGLAFFRYRMGAEAEVGARAESIEALLASGALVADPQVYEDFLPVSAAGIFQSNLGTDAASAYSERANREAFEEALGAQVADEMEIYAATERDSLRSALKTLGQDHLAEAVAAA